MQNRFAELRRRKRYLHAGDTNKLAVAKALLFLVLFGNWQTRTPTNIRNTRVFSCTHALMYLARFHKRTYARA